MGVSGGVRLRVMPGKIRVSAPFLSELLFHVPLHRKVFQMEHVPLRVWGVLLWGAHHMGILCADSVLVLVRVTSVMNHMIATVPQLFQHALIRPRAQVFPLRRGISVLVRIGFALREVKSILVRRQLNGHGFVWGVPVLEMLLAAP